jgi:hypothetical protein
MNQRKDFFLLRQFRKKPFLDYYHHHRLAKVALTDFAAVIVMVQAPLPEHPPDQPVKV